MDLINVLEESNCAGSGGTKILRRYGINDDADITRPFAEMHLEKVIRIVLNWLTINAKNGYENELRIPVAERQAIYKSKIGMRGGAIFVRRVKKAPELKSKVLHQWDSKVNYQTLTLKEIIRSVHRADVTTRKMVVY